MTELASHRQVADVPRAADSIMLLPTDLPAPSEVNEAIKPASTPQSKEK